MLVALFWKGYESENAFVIDEMIRLFTFWKINDGITDYGSLSTIDLRPKEFNLQTSGKFFSKSIYSTMKLNQRDAD